MFCSSACRCLWAVCVALTVASLPVVADESELAIDELPAAEKKAVLAKDLVSDTAVAKAPAGAADITKEGKGNEIPEQQDSIDKQAGTGEPSTISATAVISDATLEQMVPSPSPELKKAENIDLKEVINEQGEPVYEQKPEPAGVELNAKNNSQQPPVPDVADQLETETATQKPLIMLDNEVPPGTSTRLSWTPDVSFMGIAAPTAVLVVHGVKPGPKVCLTAAIHGDELNGIEVVRHVLYSIDPQELSGTVIGVPIVNLQGFRRSSRYLPDRRDLNRYFPGNANGSSASRIAHSFFHQVIGQCDLLVDLHTGSFHRTNLPQLRANLQQPQVAELARQMGAIVVVHSEGTPGCLRRAASDAGIPAVTLEAGQPHQLQKSSVNHGIKSVENLLDSLGMVDRRPFWKLKSEPVYYQSQWVRVPSGGILFSDVELGESVNKGRVLGVITDPITNARQEVLAPFDGRIIGMALNQVMYPGFAAYHLGLQSSVEAVEQDSEDGVPGQDSNDDGGIEPVDAVEPQSDDLDVRILEDS